MTLSNCQGVHAPVHQYDGLFFYALNEPQTIQKEPERFIANVSWYTPSEDEGCNTDGITASGRKAVAGVTVAADHLPLGSWVRINGHEYRVDDCFGGDYTDRIDIFCESKEEALNNGRQYLEVEILD